MLLTTANLSGVLNQATDDDGTNAMPVAAQRTSPRVPVVT